MWAWTILCTLRETSIYILSYCVLGIFITHYENNGGTGRSRRFRKWLKVAHKTETDNNPLMFARTTTRPCSRIISVVALFRSWKLRLNSFYCFSELTGYAIVRVFVLDRWIIRGFMTLSFAREWGWFFDGFCYVLICMSYKGASGLTFNGRSMSYGRNRLLCQFQLKSRRKLRKLSEIVNLCDKISSDSSG